MGQDRNAIARFSRDGVPIVRGLHVVGDARAKTNNLYAWGIGLAVWQAIALAESIDQHPGDDISHAQAFEARVGEELELRHALAVRRDRARAASHRGDDHYDGEPPIFRELDDAFETAFTSVQDDDVALLFARREYQVAPIAGDAADDDAFRAEVIRRARARPAKPSAPVFAVDEETLVEATLAAERAKIVAGRSDELEDSDAPGCPARGWAPVDPGFRRLARSIRAGWGTRPGARHSIVRRCGSRRPHEAAQESNLPSGGLHRPAGFEDRIPTRELPPRREGSGRPESLLRPPAACRRARSVRSRCSARPRRASPSP